MSKKRKLTYEELTRPASPEDLPPFPPEESEFCEVHWHNTPSGGDLSVAYFFDKEGNKCDRANAYSMNIIEYTKDGRRVNEHYGVLGR
jgi:hypothetical protein